MPDIYDFEIYFFGLICIHGNNPARQAGRTKKVKARLLYDVDHTSSIYLSDPRIVMDIATSITFGNLPGGAATVLDSFTELVPHLEDLTLPPYYLKDPDANDKIVTLPGGLLAAVDQYIAQYDNQAEYILNSKPVSTGCVARVTLLHVSTVQPEVIVTVDGTDTRAPADGIVLIANAEKQQVPPRSGGPGRMERPGFKKHRSATNTNSNDQFATLYELTDQSCTRLVSNPTRIQARHLKTVIGIINSYPVALHPECSNTQWP